MIGDESLVKRYTVECRFLRAFYYFQLVRLFGKVPVLETPKTAAELTSIPRSPVADIYALVESDLTYAAENLPASYIANNIGRATSYAAKGIVGLVYLTK